MRTENENRTGILVVSFGTSHQDACKKTIDVIEQEIRESYPEFPVYRAWMSAHIRKKLEVHGNLHICGVTEALENMHQAGIERVIVQSTHILNGFEQERMQQELYEKQELFREIRIGAPLLADREDCVYMAELIQKEWNVPKKVMLIFMGHGAAELWKSSGSLAAKAYIWINDLLKEQGCTNCMIAAIEGKPSLDEALQAVEKIKPEKVFLTPFMIVAGEHARKQMAGEQADSWKSIFEQAGYQTECLEKGLGEYAGVRRRIREHLQDTEQILSI